MTAPGWYRDPDGQPGTERWWDGTRWGIRRAAPLPPGPVGYQPLGPPPAFVPTPQTSGSAIGSLVVAILWLGGIGSIIAVFLGIHAKREIRRANGTVSGSGVATGGIVVGIIGIFGAVAVWALVASLAVTVHHDIDQFRTTTVALGQTATLDGSNDGGITSVTVRSFDPTTPFVDERQYLATVQVCAGGSGSTAGPSPADFTLEASDGQTVVAEPTTTRAPAIQSVGALAAGACATGYVEFGIDGDDGQPATVIYEPSLRTLRWTLPQG